MATFTGSISQFLTAGAIPGQVASRPTRADPARNGLTPFLLSGKQDGALTKHQPTAILTRSLAGKRARSYLDDYYFQIYFIPPTVNFGYLGVAGSQSTVIWNANLNPETIESLTETGFVGLSLTMPALPYTMKALAQRTISVYASLVGPNLIVAELDLTFSPPTFTPPLPILGTRAELWPLAINWAESVVVTLAFKTDILQARNETEQRRAVRQTPRKTIEFTSTAMVNADTITLHQFLATVQPITVIVPEPGMHAYTSVDALATDSMLYFPSIPPWLLAGLSVQVTQGTTTFVSQVISVDHTAGTVLLISEIGFALQAGAMLVALRQVNLETKMSADRILRITAGMRNKYAVVPTSEPVYSPPAAPTTYAGYEVFLLKPDWSKPITEQFDWTVESIDYDWGTIQRYPISPQQTRTIRAEYWANGALGCLAVADFFYRMMGMQGEFFMPTFDDDLPLRVGILAGQNTLRVVGTATANAFYNGLPYEFIAIQLNNGTYEFVQVRSVSIVTDSIGVDTLIELTTTLPAISLDRIRMVSWMFIWRFASDQLVMEWKSNNVGVATANFRTRPYNAGATP
jgi:hypothetical protein